MKYLVMACKPGRVLHLECATVRAAATAARFYRKTGWAVDVLREVRP
jgi:hypothetical protein